VREERLDPLELMVQPEPLELMVQPEPPVKRVIQVQMEPLL
jgi:hypothetical protein